MSQTVVTMLQGLTGPWIYVLIGVLALLESAAFIGLAVPGEIALLFGGVLAAQGRVSVALLIVVAVAGAIIGDSIGYGFGRIGAEPLRRSWLGRRVGPARLSAAEAYLRRRGGIAVFTGRFVGVLRALVPFVAGAGRMPYGRFAVWNIAGALVWAPLCVATGFLAGDSYRLIADYAGRVGSVAIGLLGLGVIATVLVWRHKRTVAGRA